MLLIVGEVGEQCCKLIFNFQLSRHWSPYHTSSPTGEVAVVDRGSFPSQFWTAATKTRKASMRQSSKLCTRHKARKTSRPRRSRRRSRSQKRGTFKRRACSRFAALAQRPMLHSMRKTTGTTGFVDAARDTPLVKVHAPSAVRPTVLHLR